MERRFIVPTAMKLRDIASDMERAESELARAERLRDIIAKDGAFDFKSGEHYQLIVMIRGPLKEQILAVCNQHVETLKARVDKIEPTVTYTHETPKPDSN